MSRTRRNKISKPGPKRDPVWGKVGPILILTEGEKTEKQYFDQLAQRLDVGAWVEVVERVRSAPIKIAEKAQTLVKEKADYGIIYCVFDKDTHSRYDEALRLINSINKESSIEVHAISSVPCFEFWLRLHSSRSDRPYSSAEEVKKELKKIAEFKDYDKSIQGTLFEYLFENRSDAADNASLVLKSARRHQGKVKHHYENPSTRVHIILKMLERYTKMKPS